MRPWSGGSGDEEHHLPAIEARRANGEVGSPGGDFEAYGDVSPAPSVGIFDRLMVGTAPLDPVDLYMKGRFLALGPFTAAAQLGATLPVFDLDDDGTEASLGLRGEAFLSLRADDQVTVTALGGWQRRWDRQFVDAGVSATLAVDHGNLLQVAVKGIYVAAGPRRGSLSAGSVDYATRFFYAVAWEVFRMGFGVERRAEQDGDTVASGLAPVVELWWRW